MVPILSMHMWTSLSSEQRARIRALFSIPRSQSTEVHDGKIVTDGTTPQDFQALTVEKMQTYLKSEVSDFHALFDLVVARIQDEIEGKPFVETVVISAEPLTVIIPPVKKTKRNANAKKGK